MIRLFVALALPTEIRSVLTQLVGGIPGARWLPPENYHLTLRFIGEVELWQAEDIDHALGMIRSRPFNLVLRGVDAFEKSGRFSTLWVGVEKNEELNLLQSKIEGALQRIGLSADRKRFAPHVSLARVDKTLPEKVIAYVQTHNLFRAPTVSVEQFTLFSSRLGKEAAVYSPEVTYDLV